MSLMISYLIVTIQFKGIFIFAEYFSHLWLFSAIVDSAVLKTRDGTAKEFVLNDDTSKIKCIFYEIVSKYFYHSVMKFEIKLWK